ncbi:hypothetical protein A3E45_02200 [Candidatus Daviesbacteria bacterium RIFCSPHIGHO2_12_FULL_43_11]|uniref:Glycosyltransferase RgtA/B/C/D-like domain-containing protein n=1 Tax=Candidatus Daviesbacteria bacterium RIFCSPHIGHO2_12_FULL_43_11 TaxID=1797780 RepID=A0A1F5K820_9BACT|nr:MAG: hypothetical protein A3E45_02200 [Candidatus Daviesbacteria bacterium RIFCSPHIGHO2_12_FULL_43_11]
MKLLNIRIESALLFLITLIGGFFRFYNLNWDNFHYFHPDERNIAMAVSKIRFFSHLNPEFFAYGGLTVYLYRTLAEITAAVTHNTTWLSDWGHISLIGRFASAFFSTLTIPAIFFLGKKLFTTGVGLLSALFFALTVSSIQSAHFSTTESILALSATLLSLLSLHLFHKPNLGGYLLTAALLGASAAAKTTAIIFAVIPITSHIMASLKDRKNLLQTNLNLLPFLTLALVTFTLLSPYTFLSWNKFLESMAYESGVVSGTLPVPYTLQFTGTLPYIFQIQNLIFQMGLILIPAILGVGLLIYTAIRRRDPRLMIFLILPVLYFAYVGSWHTKFIRYIVPLLPFFAIAAAYFLFWVKKRIPRLGSSLIIFFTLITALWALAFASIYIRQQTRITASEWIYQNIPPGAKILGEHWDDGIPIPLGTLTPARYKGEALTIYEPDNQAKVQYFAEKLSGADYLIISSRRLYGTLINLPGKYPVTSRYYKLLFDEQLGYQKVAEFSSYPNILGFEINDDGSEETFQVYDHPKVIIFQNIDKLTFESLAMILSP